MLFVFFFLLPFTNYVFLLPLHAVGVTVRRFLLLFVVDIASGTGRWLSVSVLVSIFVPFKIKEGSFMLPAIKMMKMKERLIRKASKQNDPKVCSIFLNAETFKMRAICVEPFYYFCTPRTGFNWLQEGRRSCIFFITHLTRLHSRPHVQF